MIKLMNVSSWKKKENNFNIFTWNWEWVSHLIVFHPIKFHELRIKMRSNSWQISTERQQCHLLMISGHFCFLTFWYTQKIYKYYRDWIGICLGQRVKCEWSHSFFSHNHNNHLCSLVTTTSMYVCVLNEAAHKTHIDRQKKSGIVFQKIYMMTALISMTAFGYNYCSCTHIHTNRKKNRHSSFKVPQCTYISLCRRIASEFVIEWLLYCIWVDSCS